MFLFQSFFKVKVIVFIYLYFQVVQCRIVGPWTDPMDKLSSDRNVLHWEEQMRWLLHQNERVRSLLFWSEKVTWMESVELDHDQTIQKSAFRVLYQWPSETEVAVNVILDNEYGYRFVFGSGVWERFGITSVRDGCYRGVVARGMGVKKVGDLLYFAGGSMDPEGRTIFCALDLRDGLVSVNRSFEYDGVIRNIGLEELLDPGKLIIFFGSSRLVNNAKEYQIRDQEFTDFELNGLPGMSSISVRDSIFIPLRQRIAALSIRGELYNLHLGQRRVSFWKDLGKSKLFPIAHNFIFAQYSSHSIRIQWEDFDLDVTHEFMDHPINGISLTDFEVLHHPKADLIFIKADGDDESIEGSFGFVQLQGKLFSLSTDALYEWNQDLFIQQERLTTDPFSGQLFDSDSSEFYGISTEGDLWKYESGNFTKLYIPDIPSVMQSAGCVINGTLYLYGGKEPQVSNRRTIVKLNDLTVFSESVALPPLLGMSVLNFNGHPIVFGGLQEDGELNQKIFSLITLEELYDGFNIKMGSSSVVIDQEILTIDDAGVHVLNNLGNGDPIYEFHPFMTMPSKLKRLLSSYFSPKKLIYRNEKLIFFTSDSSDTYVYESTIQNLIDWTPLRSDEQFGDIGDAAILNNRAYFMINGTLGFFDIETKIRSSFTTPDEFRFLSGATICSSPDRNSLFLFGGRSGTEQQELWEFPVHSRDWKKFDTQYHEPLTFDTPSITYFQDDLYITGRTQKNGHQIGGNILRYSLENQNITFFYSEENRTSTIVAGNNRIISSGMTDEGLDFYEFVNNSWIGIRKGNPIEGTKPILFWYNDILHAFLSNHEGHLYIWNDVGEYWKETNVTIAEIPWTHPTIIGHSLFAYPYDIDMKRNHHLVLDPDVPFPASSNVKSLKIRGKIYTFYPGYHFIVEFDLETRYSGFLLVERDLPSEFSIVQYGENAVLILSKDSHHYKWTVGSNEMTTFQDDLISDVDWAFSISQHSFYFGSDSFMYRYENGSKTSFGNFPVSPATFNFFNGRITVVSDNLVRNCVVEDASMDCVYAFDMNHVIGSFSYDDDTIAIAFADDKLIFHDNNTEPIQFVLQWEEVSNIIQINDRIIIGIGIRNHVLSRFFYNAETRSLFYPSSSRWMDNYIGFSVWEQRPVPKETGYCCFGLSTYDTQCSGHGDCVFDDLCSCSSEWVGDNCQEPLCFDRDSSDIEQCSNHGHCIDVDQCECIEGWDGNNCELPLCFGILSDSFEVCSGHGTCDDFDVCNCETLWTGNECQNQMHQWNDITGSAAPPEREMHSSVVYQDKLWIFGGRQGNLPDDMWNIVIDTGIVKEITPAISPDKRYGHSAVVYHHTMWVFGGTDSNDYNDLWKFNFQSESWQEEIPSGEIPSARFGHSAVIYQDEMIVFGGMASGQYMNDILKFSFSNLTWELVNHPDPPPVRSFSSAVVYQNEMWIFGGGNPEFYNDNIRTFVFESNVWIQQPSDPNPPARSHHSAEILGGRMWIFGGQNDNERLHDLWYYDKRDDKWEEINTNTPPSKRRGHSSVLYLNSMIIFGGSDGNTPTLYFSDLFQIYI